MKNWFAANGDTILTSVTTLLIAVPTGLPWWAPAITGVASILHTLFWPEPAPPGVTLASK